MKVEKIVLVVGLAALFTATPDAPADYESTVLADDPRIYLRFNEIVNTDPAADSADAIGAPQDGAQPGDYDAFIVGGDSAATVGVEGILGGGVGNTAVAFPDNVNLAAPNSQVHLPDTFDPVDYSIEMWVKPDVVRNQTLFVRTAGDPTTTYSHVVAMRADGTFENYTYDGGGKLIGNGNFNVKPMTVAEEGLWYHVVATADGGGGGMNLYVNGVLEASWGGALGTLWTDGNQYRIGAISGRGTWFGGSLDELAIYDTVIDAATVAEHYLEGSGNTLTITPVADASGLDLTPTMWHEVVYAVDASPDGTTRTVNGIDFLATDPATPGGSAVPGVTVTSNSIAGNWFGANKPEFGADADNNNLEEILYDIRWGSGASVQVDADVTVGQQYELTLLFSENFHDSATRFFHIEVEGLRLLEDFNVWTEAGGLAKLVTVKYTFTAYDDNLDVNLLPGSMGDTNPILNGFVLVQIVPAPAALPAGLAMLGLFASRRHRRRVN